jgi:hypothetical protein
MFAGYPDFQEGDLYLVPGVGPIIGPGVRGGRVNILWTAPAPGTIDVAGVTWPGDIFCMRTETEITSWTLTHNGSVISSGDILIPPCDGFMRECDPHDFSAGSGGASALLNISVLAGDQIVLAFRYADYFGVNLTVTLTQQFSDPVAAIEALAVTVFEMNLQNGIENSLDSKLDAAVNALGEANVNNDGAACNSLAAFISAVEAQRGKKITSAQADQLIAAAQEIQAMLNCGN